MRGCCSRPFVLADDFLACWYALVHGDEGAIEAGLGDRVLARRQGRWERHLGEVFESQARNHARLLQEEGELPSTSDLGRWWTTAGTPAEVDVPGLRGKRTVLLGEAKSRSTPLDHSVITTLTHKLAAAPDPVSDIVLALWSRGGVTPEVASAGLQHWMAADMVGA